MCLYLYKEYIFIKIKNTSHYVDIWKIKIRYEREATIAFENMYKHIEPF